MSEEYQQFTPADRLKWAADRDRLLRESVEKQEAAAELQKKLDAAEVLYGPLPTTATITPKAGSLQLQGHPPVVTVTAPEAGASMILAIEQIANSSTSPITKQELRQRLSKQGFADNRFGAYFYTAIMRLKKKGRISVMKDGRIGKGLA